MANKRTKLEDAELFYVQVNPEGMSQEKLAQKFDTTVKNISKIQSEYAKKAAENPQLTQVVEPTRARKAMMRQTEGKRKGVAIMTEVASEMFGDDAAEQRRKAKKDMYTNKHTTKTFPDDE